MYLNPYQEFIFKSRYARWIDSEQRREHWPEAVDRLVSYWFSKGKIDESVREELREAILTLKVMPSMRTMATAGVALDRDNVAGFNCSFAELDDPIRFDEIMYVLMCGTGGGFSSEKLVVDKLPDVPTDLINTDSVIRVRDSKRGWCEALRALILGLYAGKIQSWEVSCVRKKGEKLKTFGGRASGPEPLVSLFEFVVATFKNAAGRKLKPIECHDIVCKIAEIVVVGGVRRSALIGLSDLNDDEMRVAKSGEWWNENAQRMLANNSAVYESKPTVDVFMREWLSLWESKSGERGFFSRQASRNQAAKNGRRDINHRFGTNPCSEIILRPQQFCNLSEVVIRHDDTVETMKEKVRLATILGTLQATLTDFRYLSPIWKKNTEEEALLGVSLTGIVDNELMSGKLGFDKLSAALEELKQHAVDVNKEWAAKLGINQAAAITCVKPSGTVSELVDSGAGIHARHSPYYIRRVRGDAKDPVTQFMIAAGIPHEQCEYGSGNVVFSFPKKSPDGALCKDDFTAVEQFERWMIYQRHWCEHKPSVTIDYKDDEFMDIGAMLYKHFDEVSGVSFLPSSDHTYKQAPYEAIDEKTYEQLVSSIPEDIDWRALELFEKEDSTTSSHELACTAGGCSIV